MNDDEHRKHETPTLGLRDAVLCILAARRKAMVHQPERRVDFAGRAKYRDCAETLPAGVPDGKRRRRLFRHIE